MVKGRRPDRPRSDTLPPKEREALLRMRQLARDKGTFLSSGGKGGLPPSLVLGVMRRDDFKCKVCDSRGQGRGGIGVHHKGGIPESKWLKKKGHQNTKQNLVTICDECHDNIHEKARAEGIDGGG